MYWILIIKTLLVLGSIITLGLLPLFALLNMWIWNEIVVVYVFSCGKPITSFWIMLGLTACGFSITGLIVPLSRFIRMFKD